jgi:hypothetical protein
MSAGEVDAISEIVLRIKDWSPPSRIELARRILESLEVSAVTDDSQALTSLPPTRGVPAQAALGLLRTDNVPPDDEECRRIVEEERWKRYGY